MVYYDNGHIDIWCIYAALTFNSVTLVTFKFSTNTLVCAQQMFLSFFMIALFTFKQSWKGLCGKSNHQDKIKFKHYHNLLATIFRTFRWSFLITLLTFILDSFILTLFMQIKCYFFQLLYYHLLSDKSQ